MELRRPVRGVWPSASPTPWPSATPGGRRRGREFDRRADGIAATLLDAGVAEQDKVAQYLYNAPEYLESAFGAFKAGLATVNTNYRYTADELVYLWDNADVVAVVFHGTFSERIDELRHRAAAHPHVAVGRRRHGPCPDWATPYEDGRRPRRRDGPVVAPWGRSGDHLVLLYTGGTTGMPKGVMWRQDDLFGALDAANRKRLPPEPDLDAARERVTKPGPRNLPAAPADARHRLVQRPQQPDGRRQRRSRMEGRRFDPVELLDTVEARADQLDVDRRRRLRQADPAGARRRARALGHLARCGSSCRAA